MPYIQPLWAETSRVFDIGSPCVYSPGGWFQKLDKFVTLSPYSLLYLHMLFTLLFVLMTGASNGMTLRLISRLLSYICYIAVWFNSMGVVRGMIFHLFFWFLLLCGISHIIEIYFKALFTYICPTSMLFSLACWSWSYSQHPCGPMQKNCTDEAAAESMRREFYASRWNIVDGHWRRFWRRTGSSIFLTDSSQRCHVRPACTSFLIPLFFYSLSIFTYSFVRSQPVVVCVHWPWFFSWFHASISLILSFAPLRCFGSLAC